MFKLFSFIEVYSLSSYCYAALLITSLTLQSNDQQNEICISLSLQIPGNLVPITHIQSAAGAAISAQIQTKTSPQGTPTGQPTPILPNTPLSPPSGMTTVTLNTRPILPQQQQQRKINAGK